MINQELVKSKLNYDPLTGTFQWRKYPDKPVGRKTTNGYMDIGLGYKRYQAHRVAWMYVYGENPPEDIDHINHDRLDNRISNLRLASRSENMRNSSRSKANTSGFTGVTWDKENCKWAAQYMLHGKCNKIGRFNSMLDAVAARIRANKEYGFHENHGVG